MNKITLPSGTYAIDNILLGFDIIEKPSSNIAFVGRDFIEHRIYVQFKNGSAYMYSDVDYDTLSAIAVAESIGKFVSSHVVKKFPSEKMEKALIIALPTFDEEQQALSRSNRNSQSEPVIILRGDISNLPPKSELGVLIHTGEAKIEYIEPQPDTEPEF